MQPFCSDELQRALDEESAISAIGAFNITEATPGSATASVTLLEGRTIQINLTTSGYSEPPGPKFETIDQLLRSVSLMYEQRRQQALMSALERLSALQALED
ncbi:hypothetical protein FB45DRAFT_824282 [Roridomyces roridus]|uniref:GSKIP domain-containing protein n=1 Tax=Roridomyces roridus TaxID=1738132 RepID=A0AAD7CBH6_9AGAR|nr:hypothetical protein FB45DRAFT_824282 [Roridomyces roridus]